MPYCTCGEGAQPTSSFPNALNFHNRWEVCRDDVLSRHLSTHARTPSWNSVEGQPGGLSSKRSSTATVAAVDSTPPTAATVSKMLRPSYESCAQQQQQQQQQQAPEELVSFVSPCCAAIPALPAPTLTYSDVHTSYTGTADVASCDGADARYVGVANERVFSALRLRGSGLSATLPSPFTSPQTYRPHDGATSAVLTHQHTPVRSSLSGTPTPQRQHTPQHSTAYGDECYSRMLSSALLGGIEGSTSVLSFPMRAAPAMQRGGESQSTQSLDSLRRGREEQPLVRSYSTVAPHTPQKEEGDEEAEEGTADSNALSLGVSPLPFGLADELTVGGGDSVADTASPSYTHHCSNGNNTRRFFAMKAQPDLQEGDATQHRVSPNGPTPSFTSPVSYFQHAPLVWPATVASGARLRFSEDGKSAVVLDGGNDDNVCAAGWPAAAARTATLSPPAAGFVSPLMHARGYSQEGTAGSTTVGQADTPLFAASDVMHRLAHEEGGCCTPRHHHHHHLHHQYSEHHAYSSSDEWSDGMRKRSRAGAAAVAEETNVMPSGPHSRPASPLRLPASALRHAGFCTPPASRPTFVLPPSTARVAQMAASRTAAEDDLFSSQGHTLNDSCTTPADVDAEDLQTPLRLRSGSTEQHASISATRNHPGGLTGGRFGSGTSNGDYNVVAEHLPGREAIVGDSAALRSSLRWSPASSRSPPAALQVLSTPVRHSDNAIRDFYGSAGGRRQGGGYTPSAAVSGRFPSTPVSLSPARQLNTATAASVSATSNRYPTPSGAALHRDGLLSVPRVGAAAAAVAGSALGPHARRHSSAVMAHRDAFHFQRAMTASETSTDQRRSPLFWGCFGVLVAQQGEVWCVGKGQPFRIFPHEADAHTRLPGAAAADITVVVSTAQLSASAWEDALVADASPTCVPPALFAPVIGSPVSPLVSAAAATAQDLVYLAVGTSTGDVYVYAYGQCAPSSPGAVAVSLSSGETHPQGSLHAVQLHQCGVLCCRDRVGDACGDWTDDVDSDDGSDGAAATPAISALRIVDHWLYIGDQAGHVSRYDLRHVSFLRSVQTLSSSSSSPVAAAAGAGGGAPTVAAVRGGPTNAATRLPASPNPRMPVHHFARPAAASATRRHPPTTTATAASSTSAGPLPLPQPTFHFAVRTREPVYNIEVTEHHSYMAVGTETRLLVYRVAEMPRVVDDAAATAAAAVPASRPLFVDPLTPLASTPPRLAEAADTRMSPQVLTAGRHAREPTAPLVVVQNASQPVRCFAWMRCDYEALAGTAAPDHHTWDTDFATLSTTADSAEVLQAADVGRRGGASCSLLSSSQFHTATPSLVFATAWTEGDAAAAPARRCRTDVQLYRIVKQSVVASCTLDYPVHMLRVPAGTTQIIVGAGSRAEWPQLSSSLPNTPSPPPLPGQTPTSAGDAARSPLRTPNAQRVLSPTQSPTALSAPRTPSRSLSATTTPNTSLPPSATRTPAATFLGRRATPNVAVLAALRTLTGQAVRPSSLSTSRSIRGRNGVPLPISAVAATPHGSVDAVAPTPRPRAPPTAVDHGFLFKFEVCPSRKGSAVHDGSGDGAVCLRSRGETVVGESESVVCGVLCPSQDQAAVLVRPALGSLRRAGATAVKVKVWTLASDAHHKGTLSVHRTASSHTSPHVSAMHMMETLR